MVDLFTKKNGRHFLRILKCVFVITMISGILMGCQMGSIHQKGDVVPDFTLPDQHGSQQTLSALLAKDDTNGAILAFYIKDNSPG